MSVADLPSGLPSWPPALDPELTRRVEACEPFDLIARAVTREAGYRITREDCMRRAAELELGTAARRRVGTRHRALFVAAPRKRETPKPLEWPAPVVRAVPSVPAPGPACLIARQGVAFAAALGAGAELAQIAAKVRERIPWRGASLADGDEIEFRRIVLGLAVLRLRLDAERAAASTASDALSATLAAREVQRRLAKCLAPACGPIDGVLDVLLGVRGSLRITLREIKLTVADLSGVSVRDMESVRRTRSVVAPRHLAMALAKRLTTRSLPEIGRHFGGRDHTTVLHALRRMDGRGLAGFEPAEGAGLEESVRAAMMLVRIKAVR